jgi:hypothetical protein
MNERVSSFWRRAGCRRVGARALDRSPWDGPRPRAARVDDAHAPTTAARSLSPGGPQFSEENQGRLPTIDTPFSPPNITHIHQQHHTRTKLSLVQREREGREGKRADGARASEERAGARGRANRNTRAASPASLKMLRGVQVRVDGSAQPPSARRSPPAARRRRSSSPPPLTAPSFPLANPKNNSASPSRPPSPPAPAPATTPWAPTPPGASRSRRPSAPPSGGCWTPRPPTAPASGPRAWACSPATTGPTPPACARRRSASRFPTPSAWPPGSTRTPSAPRPCSASALASWRSAR